MPAAPVVRFATAADVPALVALEQQSFPDPGPEDSLAQEVEGPGTLVLIAAEAAASDEEGAGDASAACRRRHGQALGASIAPCDCTNSCAIKQGC